MSQLEKDEQAAVRDFLPVGGRGRLNLCQPSVEFNGVAGKQYVGRDTKGGHVSCMLY